MQSHNQHMTIALKPRKRKKDKSNQTLAPRAHWPRITISRNKTRDESNDSEKSLPRFGECSTIIDANDSNVIACDIIELFCENSDNSNEERTACPRISSSTELEDDEVDVCATCKDCVECQLQQQDNVIATAKIRKTEENLMSDQDEELAEHLDYYESDIGETALTSSTIASTEHEKAPILVDLTSEESKQATWKQTILKRFSKAEESSEISEPRIMIADSSSRLQQRGSTGSSLATALRDRGPCVIPVQPNRSLPIRPAPPTPTRSASIVTLRKTRSPILKLSKSASLDVVELQSNVSPSSSLTNELNKFPFGQQDGNGNGMMLTGEFIDRSDYILPDMTNVVQITKEINSVKRKNSEDRDKEYEKEITKDVKKRRKSHEVDAGHVRDERIKNILKEYSKTYSGNLADKGERKLQQHVLVRLWDSRLGIPDKRYSSPVEVSTTEPETEKKEICNKVVPPLRLKKIVREASTTNEYRHNIEVNSEIGSESNYRIVTGATPRPESPSGYSTTSFWSSEASENELELSDNTRDKSRRSSPKSDGYKIKYRRNRLRQKLRELRGKALELSREMTACNNATDMSPQRNTRLRQMMNCYEKQIENISKLLCKLSASIPTTDDVVVDLDYENELTSAEKTAVDSDVEQMNGISRSSVSPSPSPEPPKLSPRSPIDYEKGKSPDAVRDSPPVLPRVYIAIQPNALECLKQNLVVTKSWHKGDSSPSSPIEKEVKVNDTDQTIIHDDITMPTISPVSSSEFEDPRNSTVEWNEEETLTKMKNPEIEEKIPEDTKTFSDIEKHRQIPTMPSDSFLNPTMDLEIDGSEMRDMKERPITQGHLDEVTQVSETENKQVACEKQKLEQKSNEALPSSPSIVEDTRNTMKYGTYSEERINVKNRVVTSTVTAAQEEMVRQVPAANVTNILQLQSNYYGSSVARENVVFTDVIKNSRDVQKVTSSVSQSAALDSTIPLNFAQSRSTVSSSNQQCIVLPNSCNRVTQENTNQRNDGNRIMTEQFPTLGNWVARMSKKQATKSKSKLQSGISLPTASTAEVARIPGVEAQKIRSNAPSNTTRNNIVNVAPQWNTERWQRQQYQQRQQQMYASSAIPPVRPGICPPISVTQFYPNYAIEPYGAAFGYHSAVCPYGDYPYHSRLHATAPPISGYQLGPLQDSHAASLRQMQHLDKRYPTHLQDSASRHFTADLLKYSSTLSAGGYQSTAAAAAGLDYDRLRTTTAATQNGTTSTCLPPLLLPPPPPLPASAQQSLARTSLAGYPASNGQCGRNRMIPDVVAAAAAAAVVAAASFGRQRGTLPSYGRTDTEMVPGGISGVMDNESSQLMTNRVTNRERLPQEQMQPVGGVNVDSRLNNGSYRQLQNLILDRLPYVKADDTYSQSSTAMYDDNAQEPTVASSVPTSTYKSTTILASNNASNNALAAKEPVRKENRNCETPHLGCETAFYCDERCQTRHWNIHVEKCPKRMPKLKKLI
ncbi:PREDICTED: uncharacterized protein LOC105151052 isoform X3 [Acromyrmex echinatior]|uniref:uncharacterized protein LOC105151052 isoform X3 n=1 Tax=Acromyrmex echinatior TaxID=103372 RepID=UPI000580C6F8|nr:PREDICTED: uncharacterized protein LOC105151052 isoform X3 [Acromyrmex echinatior]